MVRRLILALALMAGLTPAIAQVPPPVPSLPDTERRTSYTISGTTCACAVNFALYGDSTDYQNWVEVFLNGTRINYNDATYGWTITSPTGPIGNIARPITDAVLTFNSSQTGTVQIVGARRPRRVSQFSENRGVAARDLNQVLTDMIAQNRETWDKINDVTGRSVRGIPGETMALLPPAATRANSNACFDSGGNLTNCASVTTGTLVAGTGIQLTGTNPTTISTTFSTGSAATANIGTSGGTVPLLNGNNTHSGNNTFSGTNTFTGSTSFTNLQLPGGTQTSSAFTAKVKCVYPDDYGAANDGVTDDTKAVITAANTAAGVNIGLCLRAGSGYAVRPIQFGNTTAQNPSGTCTGSISGTTLTVTSACSINVAPGQTISGTGVTAGTKVTAYGSSNAYGTSIGQLGTYTVDTSQTAGSTTLTFTAPSFTASISGSVMTVSAVSSGSIKTGDNVTCTNCPLGLFISSLGTGTGGTGTYNLNQSGLTVASAAMATHPSAAAAQTPFILGDDGVHAKFVGASTSSAGANRVLISFYVGALNSNYLFQYTIKNFKVDANSQYGFGLQAQGLNGTMENIYVTGATGCGIHLNGNVLNPVIYAHLRSMTARQNSGHGWCINGLDATVSYNVQAIDGVGLYSMGNGGTGWNIDYAGFACLECESESNTGNAMLIDHSLHIQLIDFYTEGNGGAVNAATNCTNTQGVMITGKVDDGIGSTLQACTTSRIRIWSATTSTFLSYPSGTCTWSDQVGGVTLANTSNCKWNIDDQNMVNVYGQFTYNTTSVTNATAALVGFAGAPSVPNQSYAGLPGILKAATGGIGAVVPVPVINTTNFNFWGNGTAANMSITSLANIVFTVKLQYPLN